MSTYAWVDLGAFLFPFLFSFHTKLRFHLTWKAWAVGTALMMGLFIPWDAIFTRAGVWGFTPEHVWSFRPLGLPLEEWLFFLCIPYACMFTYHCFAVLRVFDRVFVPVRTVSAVLMTVLMIVAIWNWQKAYTSTALSLCALWIGYTAFVQRAPWLGRFFLTYSILLLPFMVVNGILTGTGLDHPVVWYNNSENLGLRILTVPVEDVFYGMLMVGLTTSFYEAWLSRRNVYSHT